MTYAIVRKDLRQAGELPRFLDGYGYPLHITFYPIYDYLSKSIYKAKTNSQVDEFDYTLVHTETTKIFYGRGEDFEFYETIQQARSALNGK